MRMYPTGLSSIPRPPGLSRKAALCFGLVACCLLGGRNADAGPCDFISDPISKQNCLSGEIYRESRDQYWNSLSPRQQYLASNTERIQTEYMNRTGQLLAPSEDNTQVICQHIGCQSREEYAFVWDRLNFLYNARGSLENVCRQLGFASCNDMPGVR